MALAAHAKMTTELFLAWDCMQAPETLGQSDMVTLILVAEHLGRPR